jgi:hypothetical protein
VIKPETAYREFRDNFSLKVIKTKELIVDNWKRMAEHATIHIDGAAVEQVESFKFLGVHITNKLTWFKLEVNRLIGMDD